MPNVSLIHYAKQLLLGAVLALAAPWVFAQTTATAPAPTLEAPAIIVLRTLALVTATQTTLQAVQAVPSAQWQLFNPQKTYPISKDTALWMQLQLSVSAPQSGWVIRMPKPFLDRFELHWLAANGEWTMQVTGESIAHTQWPVRGLHPQFAMPALGLGEHTVFIKLENSFPTNITILTFNSRDADADALSHALRAGFITMFVFCMVFISACLAIVYRDAAYAWYSAYALFSALAVVAYTGFGYYVLWPSASYFAERSSVGFILAASMAQIVFCYVTFQPQKLWSKFTPIARVSLVVTAACIGASALENIDIRVICFLVALVICWCVIFSMVFVRLVKGETSAKLWMLAYLPTASLLFLQTIDQLGLSNQSIVGYYWVLYSLIFEVPVLLVALILRAKERDAQRVVQYARQQLDPLTGFILPRAYQVTATDVWEKAMSLDLGLAVVYVQVTQPSLSFFSGRSYGPGSERIVRVLRTVFRQEDTFAQVRDDVYAVLMPGIVLGEQLQNRLTRVIAQLYMLSQELKTEYPLRTRISACTTQSLAMPWPNVHRILLENFSDEKNWSKSTIRIVSKRHRQRRDCSDLSKFWARAVEVEANFNRTSSL